MAKAEKTVSPLAPAGGFPKLPVIDGVRYAAAEAGVRYAGRLDVMLATIDAGASVAGATTIIAVDISDTKLEWAKQFGATHTVNSKETDAVEAIKAATKPQKATSATADA